jgi:hypothetical protein
MLIWNHNDLRLVIKAVSMRREGTIKPEKGQRPSA